MAEFLTWAVVVCGVLYLLQKLGNVSGLGKLLAAVLTYLFIAWLSG